jgi:hypothetical protein
MEHLPQFLKGNRLLARSTAAFARQRNGHVGYLLDPRVQAASFSIL